MTTTTSCHPSFGEVFFFVLYPPWFWFWDLLLVLNVLPYCSLFYTTRTPITGKHILFRKINPKIFVFLSFVEAPRILHFVAIRSKLVYFTGSSFVLSRYSSWKVTYCMMSFHSGDDRGEMHIPTTYSNRIYLYISSKIFDNPSIIPVIWQTFDKHTQCHWLCIMFLPLASHNMQLNLNNLFYVCYMLSWWQCMVCIHYTFLSRYCRRNYIRPYMSDPYGKVEGFLDTRMWVLLRA